LYPIFLLHSYRLNLGQDLSPSINTQRYKEKSWSGKQ
jgi:hypothetical protein